MAWLWHHAVWITSACVLLLAVAVLGLRYWLLPNIDQYRGSIEQSVSKAAGQRVTIGQLSADWDGYRPRLHLGNLIVFDKAGRPALTLARVESTLSWLSLAWWQLRFRSIDLYEPALDIRRDKNGVVSVGGIEMGGDSQEGGFSDWLLSQRDIEVHNATINWTDEQRAAPTLELKQVGLRLLNRGERHRFGVKAIPPKAVAGPLDVRGDLTGKSLKNPADWRGRLYVHLEHTDIAAWRTWVPLPVQLNRGEGAMTAWAVIRDQTLQELTADVRLSGVRARLGQDLPEMDLTALNGRLGWKKTPTSYTVSTTQLGLTAGAKLTLQPMDLSYRATTDAKGEPVAGEFKVNAIDIAPLVELADHFPMSAEVRKQLAEISPTGRVLDASGRWDGHWSAPAKYVARGRFENVAVNRAGNLPGLKGLGGNLEANEKGGMLQLASRALTLDLPEVFKTPLVFDTITGQAQWTGEWQSEKGVQLKFSNIAIANADLAGKVEGTFQVVPKQPGIADLSGSLTRADARQATRYLPLGAGRRARPWLEAAFLAGSSNDAKFRLKGDLRDFPFDDEKKGTFTITATVTGAKLHYADGWPDIDGINGDLSFRGRRMDIVARQGTISGTRLSNVRAEIPDLDETRVLTVTGDADGATADFLKFIAASPVAGYIDHFTDGMQGEGDGKLKLQLEMPLRNLDKTRVAGSYQMAANRLILDASLPPMEQVEGRIEFTENGVNVPNATAMFFGGPLTVAGSTQRDGTVRMNLQGRADPDVLRRTAGAPAWLANFRGTTDWTGVVAVRKKTVDLALESNLQGITSTLPPPFAKTAIEPMPLRVERRFLASGRDQVTISVADLVSARLNRHNEGKRTIIDRGTVRLGGGSAPEPNRDGIYVSGGLKSVNLDHWLRFTDAGSAPGEAAPPPDVVYTLAGVDIKLGEFELYDRKFGELAVSATPVGAETTRYRLVGREVEGIADWSPQGRGRLVAQLQKLNLPSAPPSKPVPGEKRALDETKQLPALDIVADQFQIGAKPLGKLELKATQQGRDWRIEKLALTHADGTLTAEGVWQSWLTNPRTQVTVQWGIKNAGSTLGRLGYPGAVRDGVAEIAGQLAWDGGPYQIDYPSLSGKFAFRAEKGQFRQMEPGIGKLLGIISLQSLPRRLSLDFRDVFSRGFAFDEILGEITVDRGIASSDKFLITGPSAKVLMSGSVDLARETQKLEMKVSPQVSEGVAIATGLLGGPIAALATFVAQKLLKDPFGNLVAFRYSVTGSWADPVVNRVDAPAAAVRESE